MSNNLKIGIDLEKISRFKLDREDRFFKDTFTESELDYAFSNSKPEVHLCGFFCAKEALIKTLDNQAILLNEIEIEHDGKGKPSIKILKKNLKDNAEFLLSISHCRDYAVANILKIQNERK